MVSLSTVLCDFSMQLRKCLEKDPDDRFQSVDELRDCLVDIHEKLALEKVEEKVTREAIAQAKQEKLNRATRATKSATLAFAAVAIVSVIGFFCLQNDIRGTDTSGGADQYHSRNL